MKYVDINTLEVLDNVGEVRKHVAPNRLPRILTRSAINEVGVDYLYDNIPAHSVLQYPVQGEPVYKEEKNIWEFSYTFADKHTTQEQQEEFIQTALNDAKEAQRALLTKALQEKIDSLTDKAPIVEVVSFDKQEQEARAVIDGVATTTPYLDALVISRNLAETVEELAQKVVAAADVYAQAHATYVGEYQRLIKNIDEIILDDVMTVDEKIVAIQESIFA